ncbi:hypothetical protein [Haloplanus natans]|uniref:hypothetical protein n=1 Tax=Haloplanus natans TaxID=376171 RepID=UPI000677A93C|nr:hypothetical protein [Haloplanus natans]
MDWSEAVVRIVLMPADQQTSVWLDPVEPVVLVGLPSLQLKSDFDSCGRHWVLVVIEPWVHVGNDPVRASFTWLSTSPPNALELTAESVLDAVGEPLALQICPISEETDH